MHMPTQKSKYAGILNADEVLFVDEDEGSLETIESLDNSIPEKVPLLDMAELTSLRPPKLDNDFFKVQHGKISKEKEIHHNFPFKNLKSIQNNDVSVGNHKQAISLINVKNGEDFNTGNTYNVRYSNQNIKTGKIIFDDNYSFRATKSNNNKKISTSDRKKTLSSVDNKEAHLPPPNRPSNVHARKPFKPSLPDPTKIPYANKGSLEELKAAQKHTGLHSLVPTHVSIAHSRHKPERNSLKSFPKDFFRKISPPRRPANRGKSLMGISSESVSGHPLNINLSTGLPVTYWTPSHEAFGGRNWYSQTGRYIQRMRTKHGGRKRHTKHFRPSVPAVHPLMQKSILSDLRSSRFGLQNQNVSENRLNYNNALGRLVETNIKNNFSSVTILQMFVPEKSDLTTRLYKEKVNFATKKGNKLSSNTRQNLQNNGNFKTVRNQRHAQRQDNSNYHIHRDDFVLVPVEDLLLSEKRPNSKPVKQSSEREFKAGYQLMNYPRKNNKYPLSLSVGNLSSYSGSRRPPVFTGSTWLWPDR